MVAFFFFPELPWIDDWDYWDWGRLCEAASWLATEVSLSSLAQSRSLLERPKVEAATRLQEDLLTSKSQRSYYSFLTFRCELVIHSKGAYKSGIWHIILIIFHACQPFQIGNFEAAAKCPDLWQSAKAPFEFEVLIHWMQKQFWRKWPSLALELVSIKYFIQQNVSFKMSQ